MRTLTTPVAVLTLVVLALATMVWEGRGATLETAITRADVVSSCVRGTWGEKYSLSQLHPCLRAGFIVSAQRRQAARTAHSLAEVQKSFAKLDEARRRLEESASSLVPQPEDSI